MLDAPMYRTFPARTTSSSASIVSSTGVCGSQRWIWNLLSAGLHRLLESGDDLADARHHALALAGQPRDVHPALGPSAANLAVEPRALEHQPGVLEPLRAEVRD